jgi:hypothetical protein
MIPGEIYLAAITGTGGARQEVDLVPPAEKTQADAELPEPVCPAGVVTGMVDEGREEPPAPGESPLDEGLERLRQSLPGPQEVTHEHDGNRDHRSAGAGRGIVRGAACGQEAPPAAHAGWCRPGARRGHPKASRERQRPVASASGAGLPSCGHCVPPRTYNSKARTRRQRRRLWW